MRRRFGVARLKAFGSAARVYDFDPVSSDADFPVEFKPKADLTALRQVLASPKPCRILLGRRVDFVIGSLPIKNSALRPGIASLRSQ